jgi:hypothetical protein
VRHCEGHECLGGSVDGLVLRVLLDVEIEAFFHSELVFGLHEELPASGGVYFWKVSMGL